MAPCVSTLTWSWLCWQAAGDDADDDVDLDDIVRSLRKDKQAMAEQQAPSADDAALQDLQGTLDGAPGCHDPCPAQEQGHLAEPRNMGFPASSTRSKTAQGVCEQPRAAAHPAGTEVGARAAAASRAMQADAPELLELLKQHGIAERLVLLSDGAVGGSYPAALAADTGRSALSQVS